MCCQVFLGRLLSENKISLQTKSYFDVEIEIKVFLSKVISVRDCLFYVPSQSKGAYLYTQYLSLMKLMSFNFSIDLLIIMLPFTEATGMGRCLSRRFMCQMLQRDR